MNVEESETLKEAIGRLITDMGLPPNIQLRKEKAETSDDEKKTISKFLKFDVVFSFFLKKIHPSHSQGVEYELENLTKFVVNHNLYKGHLLVPHQVKDTSCKRELVDEVKVHFDRWLQQISIVLIQGIRSRASIVDCLIRKFLI